MSGYAVLPTAPPARRRRRRWPKALLIVVLVLAVLLVVVDRVSVAVAQRVTADRIEVRAPFSQKPKVTVHGIPFLTQVIRGKYRDIEVSGGGLHLGDISGAALDAHLRGVHLAASDIVGGKVSSLPCDRIDGTVTLPYDQLARLTNVPGLTLTRTGTALTASAKLTIPYTSLSLTVTGSGELSVRGQKAYLRVEALKFGSVSVPTIAVNELAGQLANIPIDLPDLPYGLQITTITPLDNGVSIAADAENAVLHADR